MLGEGALLAALRRSRGAHMRDIVTTIQREQDEAIRAPARGVTLITGGPGTGKTQVALHRAAYLLYTDRGRFTDGRILVVGPSTVFTNYIGRVLPSLGEDSVHLRAIGELVDGVTATRRDRAEVAEIKGSERMLRRAGRAGVADAANGAGPAAPGVRGPGAHPRRATTCRRPAGRCGHGARRAGTEPNGARADAVAVLVAALWTKVDGAHLDRNCSPTRSPNGASSSGSCAPGGRALTPPQVLSWLADPARVVGVDERRDAGRVYQRATGPWTTYRCSTNWPNCWAQPPKPPRAPEPEWRLRELTSGTRLAETFVLSCGLRDGWELFAPGLRRRSRVAGQAIDNNAVGAAQRWAEAIILREGHRVVGWVDGFDPYGEEGYVPVLAEPLPVAGARRRPPSRTATCTSSSTRRRTCRRWSAG